MAGDKLTLFHNALIITYNEVSSSLKILRNASMLVKNGQIEQLVEGTISNLPSGTEVVDATNKIISPGFINTHHHMWQSAFRTTASNTTLAEYFAGRYSQMGPAGKHFSPEDVYLGQLACALEMIEGGTTTVLDHAHGVFTNDHIDAAVSASFASGLRVFFAHTVQDIQTTGYASKMATEKLLQLSKDPRFADPTNPVALGVAYDSWWFVPAEANEKFMEMINDHNENVSKANAPMSLITSHFVGGAFSPHKSPSMVDSLPDSALSRSTKLPIIFSHASFMSNKDAETLRAHPHLSISTTPESEAHYGHTSVGADMCQDCASLGVDTHFTFSSYMPIQARLWLQSLRYKWYRETLVNHGEVPINNPMSCEAAFLLMTQKGGEALGRKDLGVIKVGAQADLVLIDTTNSASLWGVDDPVAAVILHTGGAGDIEGVMVQGKWLKKNHQLVSPLVGGDESTITVDSVRSRFEGSAARLQKVWKDMEPTVLEEGVKSMSGAKYGRCQNVDVKRGISARA